MFTKDLSVNENIQYIKTSVNQFLNVKDDFVSGSLEVNDLTINKTLELIGGNFIINNL